MASIRDFKKGLAYLANDLVTTLCLKSSEKGADNDNKTADLIVKAMAIKAEYLRKVNHIENPHDKKAVKTYFAQLKEELNNKVSEIVKEINAL